MFRTGYNGTSVRDIVATANVAQGSFTNHFRSKEAFTGEVLDLYFEHVKELGREALGDATQSPRQRLMHYLDVITVRLANDGYLRGCLIGDLSAEASTQSEALRGQLQVMYGEWCELFADCIAQAQAQGEIRTDFNPLDLAEFLLASWEGAILRMKVEQSPAALERFKRIAFKTVFTK
jgi:TetR/AcrR family transcriptional regulator, transcriptional repressor for nem operon